MDLHTRYLRMLVTADSLSLPCILQVLWTYLKLKINNKRFLYLSKDFFYYLINAIVLSKEITLRL